MKRFKNFTKTVAVALAMLVFLSGFSVLASAVDYEKVTVSADDYLKDESGETATPDEASARKKGVYSTGANNETYHIYSNSSYGMRFKDSSLPFTFTNQVNGKKTTYPSGWGAWEYEYAKSDSTGKTTAVWCIQPGVAINGATYFMNGEGANTDYWKALKKNKDLYNAVSATLAFGKYKGATQNGPYYYAVGGLLWDFLSKARDPVTFEKTDEVKPQDKASSKKYSYLDMAKNTISAERLNAVKEATKDILSDMKKMYKPMPEAVSKNDQVYNTMANAKKNQTKKDYSIKLDDPNSKGEYKGESKQIKEFSGYNDISYKIVNENDKTPDADKNFTVSYKNKKFSVSTTANLRTLADKGHYYYIKITRKVTNYTSSVEDKLWQSSLGNVQTMLNSLEFSVPEQTAYIPLFYEHKEELGSLFIEKDITTNISGVDYNDDYSGWYFSATNQTTNKTTVLKTNSSGSTEYIEDIILGTKFKIKELGRLISSTDNESDFSKVTTVSGKKYGFPQGFTDVTGGGQEKTYTVSSSTEAVKVEWENKAELKFPVKLTKDTDDGGPIKGYYFLVYDFASSNRLIENPTIVGPTDMYGDVEFTLDRVIPGHTIHVIELGRLKIGESADFARTLTVADVYNGSFRNRFAIPSQYKAIVDKSQIAVTGLTDTIPIPISQKNIQDFYDDPYNYEKEYTITNTTEGYIAITKTDSVTIKPIGNVTFDIYASGMNDSDGEDITSTPVATIVTDENGYGISPLLPTGIYYIVESDCPATYHIDKTKHYLEVRAGMNKVETALQYKPTNKPTTVIFNKRESSALDSNGKQLAGCVIQFFEKPASGKIDYNTAKPVHEFTTTDSPEKVIGVLKVNKTYIAHEKSCPAGFCLADDVEFTVKSDGSDTTVTMTDKSTKIQAIKLDKSTNSYMADIRLQIQDSAGKPVKVRDYDGNLVESWITTTSPLTIEGILEAGKPYKLVELETKPGYTLADPVPFTVKGDGELQKITVENEPTRFKLSKKDITGTNEIPGCIIDLKEKGASTTLLTWTSGTEPKYIEGLLEVGKTYVMTERKPADGYVTATSIEFTVLNNGSVQTVTMKDDTTKVKVLKLDSSTKNNLAGALMQVQDLNGKPIKIKDYDGKLVESWRTRSTPLTIEGILAVNTTYQLVELEAPAGYVVAPPKKFTVEDKETVQTVTMYDDTTKVEFRKLAGDTNKQLSDCVMQLTDSKGKLIKRFTTTDKAYYLEGVLIAGETYTLTEVTAREGYMKAEPITFKVGTDGKKQVVTMTDLKYSAPDLPKTGGDSAFPFTAVGAACFIGAAITLIVRLKLKKSKN